MRTNQQHSGFVLFMVLMVMVMMSITGLALMKSVDTGTLVANNVGFKQAAILSSEAGVKAATDWLAAHGDLLSEEHATDGYYEIGSQVLDWTGADTVTTDDNVDWDGTDGSLHYHAKTVSASADSSGNRVYYIIHRLCDATGSSGAVGTSCATNESETAAQGSTKGGGQYGSAPMTISMQVYYRITVHVAGPRNTSSYTQAYVLL